MNPIREIRNFRDLGRYKTEDGRTVKKGLLFRSCYLGWMNPEELRFIRDIGVRSVLDLRTSYEVFENPDPELGSIQYFRVSGMRDRNGEGVDFSPCGIHKMVLKKDHSAAELSNHMEQLYKDMMFKNDAFSFFIELCKGEEFKNPFPLLFHCATGKDRTGALAALIYLILGVSVENIIEDFLLSNIAYRERIEKLFTENAEKIKTNPSLKRKLQMEAGVDEEMGKEMLNEILIRYRSYDEFFRKEYNIDSEFKKIIQNKFLL